jgi:hypothetical protein
MASGNIAPLGELERAFYAKAKRIALTLIGSMVAVAAIAFAYYQGFERGKDAAFCAVLQMNVPEGIVPCHQPLRSWEWK